MKLVDPQAQRLLDTWAKQPSTPLATLTAEQVRADDLSVQALSGPPEDVLSIQNIELSDIHEEVTARVYRPKEGNLPVLLYFHGGGFLVGPEGYDIPLRSLVNKLGCLLICVTCRLAPEHPYPAAIDDAYAAAVWLNNHIHELGGDANQIGIAGDSSGGNLAAYITQQLRQTGAFSPRFQILIYPMLDATMSTPSYTTFATGFGFTAAKSGWYFDQYLAVDVDRKKPKVSPYWQADLTNLVPTFVATAGCDPLRDEAEAYAERLTLADVPTVLKRYPGMIHGFFQMAGVLDQGRVLHDDIANYARAGFGLQAS